jgi:heat shock protein HtpX
MNSSPSGESPQPNVRERERSRQRRMYYSRLVRLKVWITLAALSFALVAAGQHVADRYGIIGGFVLALGLNALVFLYTDLRLSHLFHGEEIDGHDAWGILRMTKELAARAQIKAPRVHLMKTSPCAFSAGLTQGTTHLFLSEALLKKLSPHELQAVLAIEMARMKTNYTSVATAVSALGGLLMALPVLIDQTIFLQGLRRTKPGQIGPAVLLISPFVGLLVQLALGRRITLQTDQLAATWIGSPRFVAQAISKIDSYEKVLPLKVWLADAHLFTVNPLLCQTWCRYVHVQPQAIERISALTGHSQL